MPGLAHLHLFLPSLGSQGHTRWPYPHLSYIQAKFLTHRGRCEIPERSRGPYISVFDVRAFSTQLSLLYISTLGMYVSGPVHPAGACFVSLFSIVL